MGSYRDESKRFLEGLKNGTILSSQYCPNDASEEEKARYSLCQEICKIVIVSKLDIKETSEYLGITERAFNRVCYSYYKEFSEDYLLGILNKLKNKK